MSKRSRRLTGQDEALWNAVKRTVTPLPENLGHLPSPPSADRVLSPPPARPPDKLQPARPKHRPLEPADPRRERLVAKGRLDIDAVLDLHGMRQEEADRAVSAFIARALRRGYRVLLVITGKGSTQSEHGRGVLRKRFLQAVEAGLYGPRISSVRPAHQRHGGSGAFYVFLKAPKSRDTASRDGVTKALRLGPKADRG